MIGRLWRNLLYIARRDKFDAELEEEMRLHRELRSERTFGNVTALKESSRDEWSWRWLDELLQNLRYGFRMLGRSKGFTFVTIATLALAIGANTAVFSILNAVLLRPLPYRQSERLVVIYDQFTKRPGHGAMFAPYADFDRYQHEANSFSKIAADTWAMGGKTWRQGSRSTTILTVQVTRDFFQTLGVEAELGRTFVASDTDEGCAVVLADKFWRTKLNADPEVLRKPILLDHTSCRVVGVMPTQFEFYPRITPVWMLADSAMRKRDDFIVGTVARLKPDVTIAQAQTEVSAIHRTLHVTNDHQKMFEPQVHAIRDELTFLAGRTLRTTIWMMSAAVFCVLLIACVNVANLWTGKALARERELAVRTAIGAGRQRLIRQLLTEALLLASAGSLGGIALAWVAISAFNLSMPIELPVGAHVTIDVPVIAFSCAMAAGTTLLFGLLPALRAAQVDVNQSLKSASRYAPQTFGGRRLASWLVTFEVALSMVLLIGAASFVNSLQKLGNESLGFDPYGLALTSVTLNGPRYATPEARLAFYRQLRQQVTGKIDFTAASNLPPHTGGSNVVQVQGRTMTADDRIGDTASLSVSPRYFSAMCTRQLMGRDFNDSDQAKSLPVAIVNQSLASEYFPHENPLGKQIRIGRDPKEPWVTIVGVVSDQKHTQLMHEMSWIATPFVYRPLAQDPPTRLEIVMREGDRKGQRTLHQQISLLDADVPVFDWDTMENRLAETMKFARFRASLVTWFAVAAVLLASIGLHGVLSQLVTQRTREFGLRMAIGARAADVFWMVAKQGCVPIGIGLAAGLFAALGLQRFLASLLYNERTTDVPIILVSALLLLLVSIAAICLPSWRASHIDPAVALRNE